ncbi:uncharacterized protein N7496_003100 [Penicillium cataractarum]|uniref:SNF2 N-terminal domain-containing protein n=1 Tax=Penicillium cataractarum TaxID=2100454 RepID=A0A9W9SLV9_9EURO|nr:uncharacterized protein N7496_003100 [Penicillium cataractarum]KAJ5380672.1 hypothetical protein N7496_003100 [Penicillium cataractarum]
MKQGVRGQWPTSEWVESAHKMRLEKVSAPSSPLEDACGYAGIPVIHGVPILSPENIRPGTGRTTILRPWQPSAIAWLMGQLGSPLQGGILSDACGMGKTLTSLCVIYFLIQRKMEYDWSPTFRASLIVVPSSDIPQWVDQIERYFGSKFNVLIFMGDPEHLQDSNRKQRTVKSTADLLKKLDDLDPSDPRTAYTLVVTTYDTMHLRTTRLVYSS